jgi:hypothetical protein
MLTATTLYKCLCQERFLKVLTRVKAARTIQDRTNLYAKVVKKFYAKQILKIEYKIFKKVIQLQSVQY